LLALLRFRPRDLPRSLLGRFHCLLLRARCHAPLTADCWKPLRNFYMPLNGFSPTSSITSAKASKIFGSLS
jgi:hypothetical protein